MSKTRARRRWVSVCGSVFKQISHFLRKNWVRAPAEIDFSLRACFLSKFYNFSALFFWRLFGSLCSAIFFQAAKRILWKRKIWIWATISQLLIISMCRKIQHTFVRESTFCKKKKRNTRVVLKKETEKAKYRNWKIYLWN